MLILTGRLPPKDSINANFTLSLTAEERTRSRYRLEIPDGQSVCLRLPRGTVLNEGDLLHSETGDTIVRITAKPEPVLTVIGKTESDLLRAAYHLGNRHVALEIGVKYLRLTPDSVLHSMLIGLGLKVKEEIAPFYPEIGAYGHSH